MLSTDGRREHRRLVWHAIAVAAALLSAGIVRASTTFSEVIYDGTFNGSVSSFGGVWFSTSDTTTPLTGHATPGPAPGSTAYAVSDEDSVSDGSLFLRFNVPAGFSGTLSFDMFVNTYAPPIIGGPLSDLSDPNQYAEADFFAGQVSGSLVTDTPLEVLYQGADPMVDGGSNPYTHYSFDISSFTASGGDFTLRFGVVANQNTINMGFDNVRLDGVVADSGVPEPGTILLYAAGFGVLFLRKRVAKERL